MGGAAAAGAGLELAEWSARDAVERGGMRLWLGDRTPEEELKAWPAELCASR